MAALPWLLASYLLGAMPTSYLAARLFRGIDLRQHGSRNLGATNLYRVLGWRFAIPVGLFDAAKGLVPVLVFAPRVSSSELFALVCGMTAVLGHVFSVFVGFKGGKGVATAAGVMLGLTPAALGVALVGVGARWCTLTGYVSLGSIAAAAVFPVAVWLIDPPERPAMLWLDVAVAAAIIWLHRANIRRLLKGTENRFGRRRGVRRAPHERDRRPRRGQLGHDARQPARLQGRARSGSGRSSPRWSRRSIAHHENPVFLPGRAARRGSACGRRSARGRRGRARSSSRRRRATWRARCAGQVARTPLRPERSSSAPPRASRPTRSR